VFLELVVEELVDESAAGEAVGLLLAAGEGEFAEDHLQGVDLY
jgi:hypothetical protein